MIAIIVFIALGILGFAMVKDYQKQLNQLAYLEIKIKEDTVKQNKGL